MRAKSGYVALKLKKMAYVLSPSKSLVLRAKNGYVARKLKFKMAYVSSPSKSLVLRAKNGYVVRKLKKMAYVSFSGEMKAIYDVN